MSQAGIISESGALPPSVATTYTCEVGSASPAAHNLNVFGGTGAQTTGAGSTITIKVITDGFIWTEQSGPSYNIAIQNGVFCNASMTVNLPSLPISPASTGASVIIYNDFGANVVVVPFAGQLIQLAEMTTAVSATSIEKGDILELVFKNGDTTWHTISSVGTWNLA